MATAASRRSRAVQTPPQWRVTAPQGGPPPAVPVIVRPAPVASGISVRKPPEAALAELRKLCWHYLDLCPPPDTRSRAARLLYQLATEALAVLDDFEQRLADTIGASVEELRYLRDCAAEWPQSFPNRLDTPSAVRGRLTDLQAECAALRQRLSEAGAPRRACATDPAAQFGALLAAAHRSAECGAAAAAEAPPPLELAPSGPRSAAGASSADAEGPPDPPPARGGQRRGTLRPSEAACQQEQGRPPRGRDTLQPSAAPPEQEPPRGAHGQQQQQPGGRQRGRRSTLQLSEALAAEGARRGGAAAAAAPPGEWQPVVKDRVLPATSYRPSVPIGASACPSWLAPRGHPQRLPSHDSLIRRAAAADAVQRKEAAGRSQLEEMRCVSLSSYDPAAASGPCLPEHVTVRAAARSASLPPAPAAEWLRNEARRVKDRVDAAAFMRTL
eukprot:TRINITY_DN4602_c0_g1_i1.p1 TRINITY_DN4602_c0_g1~~TRINITY_DN4602_c0_g1_i1.p1  ORF type:complete len:469 (+),score=147.07 TRINITY_DN4602_c0_g1_i1:81-1409(+)